MAGQWHHGDMNHLQHHVWLILVVMFAWPAGIVVGNLIANVVWLPVQWLGLHLKLAAHHGAIHDRLDAIVAHLDACPNCGYRRSEGDLQRRDDAS